MAKAKYLITKTKLPYIVVALIIVAIMLGMSFKLNNINHHVNSELVADHARIRREINVNHNKIFKYRTQLSALSDQHSSYLLRSMMTQAISTEMNNKNKGTVKLHNLSKNPQYMKMTRTDMKIDDKDNVHIDNLQRIINNEENTLPSKKPHYLTNNMFSPQFNGSNTEKKNFRGMVIYGTSIGILFIIDVLILIYKIVKKKDN